MSSYTEDRDATVYQLALARVPLDDIRKLLRNATALQRYAVEACNRNLSDVELRRADRFKDRTEELCQAHGLSVRIGGDPRGYVVKVALPSGAYNTWGGRESGWGIPVRA